MLKGWIEIQWHLKQKEYWEGAVSLFPLVRQYSGEMRTIFLGDQNRNHPSLNGRGIPADISPLVKQAN